LVDSVENGRLNPLEVPLTEAYQDLRQLSAEVDSRLAIDEMLNEILGSKILKVQELARILAAPELYVSRLKDITPRELGRLVVYKQPVKMTHLGHDGLTSALNRVIQHLEALSKEYPPDNVPEMTGVPDDYKFSSEDSVFLVDLDKYTKKIPRRRKIPIDKLLDCDDFDLFLKRFLYVVVLISRGELEYFQETREVIRR
jgi:hypothetical protein